MLCQLSGINSIIFYAADILRDAGVDNVNVGAALVQTVQLVVTVAAAPLVDRLGRRTMYCAAASTCALAAGTLSAAYFLEASGTKCNSLALASLFVYISGFALGFGGIPWVMMGELVPTSVRVKVTSLATATNWSTSCRWSRRIPRTTPRPNFETGSARSFIARTICRIQTGMSPLNLSSSTTHGSGTRTTGASTKRFQAGGCAAARMMRSKVNRAVPSMKISRS